MTDESAERKFVIRTMTIQDFDAVRSFLREHFVTGEPLLKSSAEKLETSDRSSAYLQCIEQGNSLLAVDEAERIVGLVLADTLYPADLEKHRIEAEQLGTNVIGRIMKFLSKVEIDANVFARYNVSKALYSRITTVAAAERGKGLGTRLAAALMDVGRAKGFPLMLAYCTSFYSARQKEALGMECCHSQPYADYKDEQGQVVFQPPAPHTQLRVMVMKL